MKNSTDTVVDKLFELQDVPYREFHLKLIPTIDPDRVIGIRTPNLRRFAAEFAKTEEAADFMKVLPHRYYEENNLHAFLIENMRDYKTAISELNRFLPFVDNWATCDGCSPKIFKKNTDKLLTEIKRWIDSGHTYQIRFGIKMLMEHYLTLEFSDEYPSLVASVQSEEYYVNMMRAWYFATALAKQYDAILPYLTEKRLDRWTHNKAIQKAIESFRISDEQKAYLRTLKIK